MAAKKNSISLPFLKEYNIDRKDIIIYGVSLCLFVTALLAFVFISRDISKLKQQRKSKTSMLEDYRKLQENKVKIEKENAQLQGRAQALYDRFLADSDINSFSFFVKEIATRYKALNVNIDPQKTFAQEPRTFVMSDEVVDYLVGKNVFDKGRFEPFQDGGQKITLKFAKLSVRVGMEISLGNFVAFLYCLENSSKFVEVGNLNIYGSSETDKLRIDLVISCFGKNKEFKDQVLSVLPVDTKIIESQNRVLVSFPAVEKDRSKAKKEGDFELVKYGGWSASVRSIFNPPVDLKCPEITPADLRLEAIVGDIVAFSTGGTTYFAKKGQNLRSKIGQPIAGYSSLKLLDIKEEEKKVVLQNTAGLADNADCASIRNFGMK